jgi:hypothetical protein
MDFGITFHQIHEEFIQRHRSVNKGDEMFLEFLRRVRHEEKAQRFHYQKTPEMIFDEMEKEYFGL